METPRGAIKIEARTKARLLPIREAYEWKPSGQPFLFSFTGYALLPIREAYEWKPSEVDHIPWINLPLLPIREAYEWK